MDVQNEAVLQLERWGLDRNPVAAMYQPADGSLHCSIQGFIELSGLNLFIRDELKPASNYLQVNLQSSLKSHLLPLAAVPVLKQLTALTKAIKDQLAAAFSFESGAVLFIFDVTDGDVSAKPASASQRAPGKMAHRLQ